MSHAREAIGPVVLVTLTAGVINGLGFAAWLPHLFPDLGTFGRWLLQLTAWYMVTLIPIFLVVSVLVGIFDRRSLEPPKVARFYLLVSSGVIAWIWLSIWLNFRLIPRPVQVDALHLAANAGLTAAMVILVSGLVRTRILTWPWRLPYKLAMAAAPLIVVVGLVLAIRAPGEQPESGQDGGNLSVELDATRQVGESYNLLLITVDTLRADHLGHYGYPRATSPFLDSLAEEGTVFDFAFCQKGSTPVSVASIMTGTYPRRHGIHNTSQVLAKKHLTLAEVLREAGYHTSAVVTNGNLYPLYQFDQGFLEYTYESALADRLIDLAIEWVEREPAEPFFLWIHTLDPHDPYAPPSPYDRLFVGDGHYTWETLPSEIPSTLRRSTEGFEGYAAEPQENLAWHLAQYDGEIRFTDDQLKRLGEVLELRGLLDRSLVVFASDHGENFGEHSAWGHGTTTDDANARVPLFFRLPGVIAEGGRIQNITESVDITPTILDLLGLKVPDSIQGRSRAAELRDPAATPEDSRVAVVEGGFGHHIGQGLQQALRDPHWHFVSRDLEWIRRIENPIEIFWIWNAALEGGLAEDELYYLPRDSESNVIAREPDIARQMRSHLQNALEAQGPVQPEARHIPREELKELDPDVEASLRALGYIE